MCVLWIKPLSPPTDIQHTCLCRFVTLKRQKKEAVATNSETDIHTRRECLRGPFGAVKVFFHHLFAKKMVRFLSRFAMPRRRSRGRIQKEPKLPLGIVGSSLANSTISPTRSLRCNVDTQELYATKG